MRNPTQAAQRGADALDQLNDDAETEKALRTSKITVLEEKAAESLRAFSDAPATPTSSDEQSKKKSQATLLLDLCANLELFHDVHRDGYAVIDRAGHREVWRLDSSDFIDWLEYEYYTKTGRAASQESIKEAIGTLAAKAKFDQSQRPVYRRVSWQGDRIYIDLANDDWQAVEIDATGWRIVQPSPVMFIRYPGMLPLPTPVHGGNLTRLKEVLNVLPEDFPLIIGFILMAARGEGPYPLLAIQGEEGTGKSTCSLRVRNLIDPSSAPLRSMTNDEQKLIRMAVKNHMIVLDNLSGMPTSVSDILCRIATGIGLTDRKLYTNSEEIIANVKNPIILNGIDAIAVRGDLADRALIIHLPAISESAREEDEVGQQRYEALCPALLGGLYTALSYALREYRNIKLERKPRMADFAVWVTAAEGAFGWEPGTIMAAYNRHREAALETSLEANPVAEAILQWMEYRTSWSGTATKLLDELGQIVPYRVSGGPSWPKSGLGMANAIERSSKLLRHFGILIKKGMRQGRKGNRIMEITKIANLSSASSAASTAAPDEPFTADVRVQTSVVVGKNDVGITSAVEVRRGAGCDATDGADNTSTNLPGDDEIEEEV